MIQTWHITPTQNIRLALQASSLDEVTRQLPEGYYSTFRTFDGCQRVLGLGAHLRRLYEPVSISGVNALSLRRQLFALLEPYRPGEARVRAMITKTGEVYVAAEPLRLLSPDVYRKGVHVETTALERESPRLKSTAFIRASDSERKHIAAEGIFEALLVKDGKILEGMTSNFFYVGQASPWRRGDIANLSYLGTAREDILPGITRQTVIDIAQGREYEVRYQPLRRDQLELAAEAFLTSSSRGVVPIVRIDAVTVGQGMPGPVTKELAAAYDAYVLEHAEPILPLE